MVATSIHSHNITCVSCGLDYNIMAERADLEAWLSGEQYIQDALHYLTPSERELLISQTCDTCWKALYPE